MLRAYGVTDKGRVRPTNEDRFAIQDDLGLCVIADGMGGHNAGEVAARVAVDAIVDFVTEKHRSLALLGDRALDWPFGFDPEFSPDGNMLRTAIQIANVQILEMAGSADHFAGMGTTVVAARAVGARLVVGHVGDSRLYILSGGRLRQVTRDDSWVAGVLAQDPHLDPILLQHHPMRNALTNVVGATPRIDVHVLEEALLDGDVLILTTDGVHGVLNEEQLRYAAQRDDAPEAIAQTVLTSALQRGSRDNCTVVAARYHNDQLKY
ncbi:MAG: serine/threonine-protein phosphatase [Acidobacteria bacterium]|nr:serine/threonine-protein phosphatase [Acidobacteriota bacterium]